MAFGKWSQNLEIFWRLLTAPSLWGKQPVAADWYITLSFITIASNVSEDKWLKNTHPREWEREEKGEGEGGKIRGACANMTQYKPSKEKWIFQVWKSQKENCGKLWAFYDICNIRCSSGVNPEATCVLQFDYYETKFRTVFWKCDFNFKAQQGHRVLLVIVLPTWHEVNCTKLKYFQESSEDHWAHCKSLGPHRASKYKTCREEFGV